MTSQHLDEAIFAELWTNASAEGVPVAPHPHLQACAECRLRFAGFSAWLQELRVDALAEAEAAIPAERLAAQQAQILRRIEAAGRPARVIAFPKHPADAPRPASVRRWIAGAAAASFVAGLGLGQMLDLRQVWSDPSGFPADQVADSRGPVEAPGIVPALATIDDDTALADLEAASIPRYEALRAYETFTPRAADFVTSSRAPRAPR